VAASPVGRFRTTTSDDLATWKFKGSPLATDSIRFLFDKGVRGTPMTKAMGWVKEEL
jgi:hypothetical protein